MVRSDTEFSGNCLSLAFSVMSLAEGVAEASAAFDGTGKRHKEKITRDRNRGDRVFFTTGHLFYAFSCRGGILS